MASDQKHDTNRGATTDAMSDLSALRASVERETIAFEKEVQTPFLPSASDSGAAFTKFEQHCQHIDHLLVPGASPLRHYSLMVTTDTTNQRVAVLYDLPNRKQEYKQLAPAEAALDPLDYFCGPILTRRTVPHFARSPISTPTVVSPNPLLCMIYARTTDGVQNGTVATLADLATSPTPLVVCDAVMCNVATSHAAQQQSALEPLNPLRLLKRNFEAYHVVCTAAGGPFFPTAQQLAIARLLSMQFQREWGNNDQEYRTLQIQRQLMFQTLSHEYKNALLATNWQQNLLRLKAWTPVTKAETVLKTQLLVGLSRLVWPQALAVALRVFGDAVGGIERLRTELLEDAQHPRVTKDFAANYERSVEYLIAFIASTVNPDALPSMMRLNSPNEIAYCENDSAELRRRSIPIMPDNDIFDRSRLDFPPLNRKENATFVGASFLVEPIRNALAYLVDHRPDNGMLAYGVFPQGDALRIIVANTKKPGKPVPVIPSLVNLRQIGAATGMATFGEPIFQVSPNDTLLIVQWDIHPHRLGTPGMTL
jgi:hypothetical protein